MFSFLKNKNKQHFKKHLINNVLLSVSGLCEASTPLISTSPGPSSPLQSLLIAPVFFCCFHIKVPHLTLEIRPACLYFSTSDGFLWEKRVIVPIMLSLSFPSRHLLFLISTSSSDLQIIVFQYCFSGPTLQRFMHKKQSVLFMSVMCIVKLRKQCNLAIRAHLSITLHTSLTSCKHNYNPLIIIQWDLNWPETLEDDKCKSIKNNTVSLLFAVFCETLYLSAKSDRSDRIHCGQFASLQTLNETIHQRMNFPERKT